MAFNALKNTEIRNRLIREGFNIINQPDGEGFTALHAAAMHKSVNDLKWLLDNGASIDAVCDRGFTPLATAAGLAHVEVVRFLLNQGANPNLGGAHRNLPIVIALNNGLPDLACKLTINIKRQEWSLQIAKLLLVAGADTGSIDRDLIQKLFGKLKISSQVPLTLKAQSLTCLYKIMRTKPEESCDKLELPSELSNIIKDCNSHEYWHS